MAEHPTIQFEEVALEEARQEANRAGALLALARELAETSDADSICAVVAAALPRVIGCRRASMLLWNPETGALEFRANTGHDVAALRHPCVGDLLYGADPVLAARLGLTRQWLHAVSLTFAHPADGREVTFTSDYPAHLAHALDILRAES